VLVSYQVHPSLPPLHFTPAVLRRIEARLFALFGLSGDPLFTPPSALTTSSAEPEEISFDTRSGRNLLDPKKHVEISAVVPRFPDSVNYVNHVERAAK
jgi:hypothetical protein